MPPASLASSSRRELPQQEVTPGPGDQATPSLSDSPDSSSSLSRDSQEMEIRRETPRGASVGKTTQKNNSSRSTPRAILNAGQRRSRPSPWRRYLESVVEAKIREHFEAQIGSGGAANMITAEEHDGTNKKSHDAASKNMEGAEEHEVERDLESGLHQALDDPADENFEQATRRSIAGKEGTRDANDNSREAKLLKKRHGKEVKKSKKSMLAQEVLSWLMFEGPSSSSNQAQERRKAIEAKGKEREGSINDEPPPEHDDLVISLPKSPSPRARRGQERSQRGDHAVQALNRSRPKSSLVRDLARWILGSQKSASMPVPKRQGRHLSYATTHGTSMQRVERLLRQGLEVERELEAAYHELSGKRGDRKKGKTVMESTKVKIGKMVLRFLIGEGERGIREAARNHEGVAEAERRRGRSRVRDEGSGETMQRIENRHHGHGPDPNSKAEAPVDIRNASPLSSSPSPPPSELPRAGAGTSRPQTHTRGRRRRKLPLPSPTDSEPSG